MKNKKDRLLLESEVIAAVDKHTNNYNRLDNDITCILEEVQEEAMIITMESKDYKYSDVTDYSFIPPKEEVSKKLTRFSTVRKILDKLESANDCVTGEALAYAIWKDFDEYDVNILLEYLQLLSNYNTSLELSSLILEALKNLYGENKE